MIRVFFLIYFIAVCAASMAQGKNSTSSLSLRNHNLITIPNTVLTQTGLVYLSLGNNATVFPPLSAIPEKNANHIRAIPPEICRLKELKILDLSFNDIRKLPAGFTDLQNLEVLDLSFNPHFDVLGQLSILRQLPKLKVLSLVWDVNPATYQKVRAGLSSRIRINFTVDQWSAHQPVQYR